MPRSNRQHRQELEKQKEKTDEVSAVLAGTLATQGGDPQSEEERELRQKLMKLAAGVLGEQEKRKDEEKERLIRRNEASRSFAEQENQKRFAEQSTCSHLKMNNIERRTSGTFLTSGQLRVSCNYCQKEWYNPPDTNLNQEPCPPHLMPSGEAIGGAVTMVPQRPEFTPTA